jgi:hypothetical protein
MDPAQITALRDRLPDTAELLDHIYDDLMFDDPFGYRWHISPSGTPFQSNGDLCGHWLPA